MSPLEIYLAVALVVAMSVAAGLGAALFHVNRVSGERWVRIRFLKARVDVHRREEIRLHAECERLRERNAVLRDELDAHRVGRPSMTAMWSAFLSTIEITSPEDPR